MDLRFHHYVLLLLSAVCCVSQWKLKDYNPKCNPDAVVSTNVARFTLLTSNVVRMEYDPNGIFEDRASSQIINRYLTVPQFHSRKENDTVIIETKFLTLKYQDGQPFGANSLSIEGHIPYQTTNGSIIHTQFNYIPSGKPSLDNSLSKNLFGTIRSLDKITGAIPLNCTENANITVWDESLHCVWAPFGRMGYALINDTNSSMFDSDTNWLSLKANNNKQDWYFFGHGISYKTALRDFGLISGAVPMLPRFMLGSMQCKWYSYNDFGIRNMVNGYKSRSLPLDVVIFDMNWHVYGPWGGYTYNTNLLPFPNLTQTWFKQQKLKTSANLHDADGISRNEKYYTQAAKALNVTNGENILFNVTDLDYMMVLEDIILSPIYEYSNNTSLHGFDFWWIDWQQGGKTGIYYNVSAINPTYLLNYVRGTDNIRNAINIRDIILSRWGGLGNQRYPIGFSGDVNHTWSSLAFQPYFTSTASNVAYGWSHDIRGKTNEYELNTRWIQWGALSPIFRTNGGGDTNCDIWDHPWQYFNIERNALQIRSELLPYLYNATYQLYMDNIQLLRPMYYDYAEFDIAYNLPQQYMLGNNLLIAPITNYSGSNAYSVDGVYGFNLSSQIIWIPPGNVWYEQHSGDYYEKERIMNRWLDLSEIPIYIKTDQVMIVQPFDENKIMGRADKTSFDHLRFDIYPSPNNNNLNGIQSLYEDDGISYDYLNETNVNNHIWTIFEWDFNKNNNNFFNANISSKGNYSSFNPNRMYSIRIYNVLPPINNKVFCNGIQLNYNRLYCDGSGNEGSSYIKTGWFYDGKTMSVTINCERSNVFNITKIEINFQSNWMNDISLTKGIKGKIHRANLCKNSLNLAYFGSFQPYNLDVVSGYNTLLGDIGDDYDKIFNLLNIFNDIYNNATQQVLSLPVGTGTHYVSQQRLNYCINLLTTI